MQEEGRTWCPSKRDSENLIDAWRKLKGMIKRCSHHSILGCVLTEQFYFGLSKDTQQFVDAVFTGGMLRSSYSQVKTALNTKPNNSNE
ncbi:hypothetical protein E5676_scaffold494G00470 [Cucumis melo var. makuwa]|uniref:Uncharacterized protein n=1 Tax=Cucumis melo var. makuwa TaxID=1194695 RepID=A0A5D3DEY4_CUCMM|nr:hypothetical protein E5676_scaffold494G00470 [Cucumis melo var. makuwa]